MRILGLFFVTVFFVGCVQVSSSRFSKVHLGMTEPEVVQILGAPASEAESKDGSKTMYYTLRENAGTINSPYSVKLVSGKVDWYGRDGAPMTTSTVIMSPIIR